MHINPQYNSIIYGDRIWMSEKELKSKPATTMVGIYILVSAEEGRRQNEREKLKKRNEELQFFYESFLFIYI